MMHIKICGLTNVDDAVAAIDAGADYLGFNFYPKSPRYLTPEACATIQAKLQDRGPKITTVGVFVNEPLVSVRAILQDCGLDLAQLHGDETPEGLNALQGQAFKAFRGTGQNHAAFAAAGPGAPAFLIDAYAANTYGGTGQVADWAAARALAAQFPIFLAGGLTPQNVAEAVAQVKPWGVDVASGVEASPGKKDRAKMGMFIRAVRKT